MLHVVAYETMIAIASYSRLDLSIGKVPYYCPCQAQPFGDHTYSHYAQRSSFPDDRGPVLSPNT